MSWHRCQNWRRQPKASATDRSGYGLAVSSFCFGCQGELQPVRKSLRSSTTRAPLKQEVGAIAGSRLAGITHIRAVASRQMISRLAVSHRSSGCKFSLYTLLYGKLFGPLPRKEDANDTFCEHVASAWHHPSFHCISAFVVQHQRWIPQPITSWLRPRPRQGAQTLTLCKTGLLGVQTLTT